ncbi:MAG: hypothetical protein AAFY34_05210 [Pseudomonadota bacterium]
MDASTCPPFAAAGEQTLQTGRRLIVSRVQTDSELAARHLVRDLPWLHSFNPCGGCFAFERAHFCRSFASFGFNLADSLVSPRRPDEHMIILIVFQ